VRPLLLALLLAFAAPAVTGTLRVTTVARRRSSGRVVDRRDTGQVGFDALL
jgi:hypothetical protein